MKNKKLITCLAVASLLTASASFAANHAHHWGYTGEEAPSHWGSLSPDYTMCSIGKNQSPINLTGMVDGNLSPLDIEYQTKGTDIVNNGHSVQVNVSPGSTIVINGQTFTLKQFHFHSPSENTIDGRSFPLEAHFVHADANGNLAVVAVMFEEGEANAELEKAWEQMPEQAGKDAMLTADINPAALIPADHDYYRFNGSLTTPPCSEGVDWFVLKSYDTVSKEQIAKFTGVMHHPNNRPVQPLYSRLVVK